MNTIAIVQARLGSHRLPRKVLMDVNGKPMLQRVIERTQQIQGIDKVVVAVPYGDLELIELVCSLSGARWQWLDYYAIRTREGKPITDADVLSRYYYAAVSHRADTIVRITADCPLLDPEVSSQVVAKFHKGGYDYVSNVHSPTFPDGLDTEVFSFEALQMAHEQATDPKDREHVTPYIWKLGSSFRKANIWNSRDESEHRWTVDELPDLLFVRQVFEHFGDTPFTTQDILDLPIANIRKREIRL